MPREYTLTDLARDTTEVAAEGATDAASEEADGSDGETAKWLTELYSQMRDDGTLEAILFGPEAAQKANQPQPNQSMQNTTQSAETDDIDPTEAIDAETIAAIGNMVISQVGDMPLSQIVEACEERPATINNVLEQHSDELKEIASDEPDEQEAEP